jgi:hypothetical protein
MIDFRKAITGGFTVGILVVCVLAISAPASAKGGGGGGGHSAGSRPPGRPPPPVFLDGSAAVRPVGSVCSVSPKPVTNGSGNVIGYRRVQVCN